MLKQRWGLSFIALLLILILSNAYLLANPNLIGKLGVLIYKHNYIKNFPSALQTVFSVVAALIVICEAVVLLFPKKVAIISLGALLTLDLIGLIYVYQTFTSLAYKITGKLFIYGAHLLPILLMIVICRYIFFTSKRKDQLLVTNQFEKAGVNAQEEV